MKRNTAVLFLIAFMGLSLRAQSNRSAFDNAVATARIHSFTEILRNSGIPIEDLRNGDVTLIIPVDTSFYKLTKEQYSQLLLSQDKDLSEKYIRSHMLSGRLSLKELVEGPHKTIGGIEIKATPAANGAPATINGHRVFQAEISGTHGIVYLIEGFLFQP